MASGTLTNLGDTVPAVVTQPLMTVSFSGTYTGGTIAFDLGDGSAWSQTPAYPIEGGPALQTVVLTANQSRTLLVPCGQAPEVRVRAVTAMGGNCAVSIAGGNAGATQAVGGDVAAGAADAGNPVKTGGVASGTAPTAATAGQRVNTWLGLSGETPVCVAATMGNYPTDAQATSGAWPSWRSANGATSQNLGGVAPRLSNGVSVDSQRNNTDLSLLASAARTATINSADQTNYNGRGVKVVVSITAAGTGTLTFAIKGKDSISGAYYTLLASAAQSGTGTVVLTVYPGVAVAANVAASDVLPRTWRVEATGADGSSWTYSASAVTII